MKNVLLNHPNNLKFPIFSRAHARWSAGVWLAVKGRDVSEHLEGRKDTRLFAHRGELFLVYCAY